MDAAPRAAKFSSSQLRVSPESMMSSTMSTCLPVMSVSRSFRIWTTPLDFVPAPYDEPGATFDSRGLDMATDDAGVSEMFDPAEFTRYQDVAKFAHELKVTPVLSPVATKTNLTVAKKLDEAPWSFDPASVKVK